MTETPRHASFFERRQRSVTAPRSVDAIAALTRILASDDPHDTVVIVQSPFVEGVPRPAESVTAGPDLKRLLADPGGTTVDPTEVLGGLLARDERTWVVVGPDAGGVTEGTGRLLVVSALGHGVSDIMSALPPVGLHIDIGRDDFNGLGGLLDLFAAGLPSHLEAVAWVGLSPSAGAMVPLLAVARQVPTIAWDPSPDRVAAWQACGVAASSDLVAVGQALTTLLATPLERPAEIRQTPRPLWIFGTSPTLTEMTRRALTGDTSTHESRFALATWDDAATDVLMSELPADVPVANPLVVPQGPAFPGLPPRHLRHLRTAMATAAAAAHEATPLVIIAVAASDPALADLEADAKAPLVPTVVITATTLGPCVAALDLALQALRRPAPGPPPVTLDPRLQTLVMAALLMRRRTLTGHEASSLVQAVTGIPAAPRQLATTVAQAENIARHTGFPLAIGVAPGHRGLRAGTPDVGTPPPPVLVTDAGAVETAFNLANEHPDFAWEPRFLAGLGNEPGTTRQLWHLRCDAAPVAWRFRATATSGTQHPDIITFSGHIGTGNRDASTPLPPFAHAAFQAVVRAANSFSEFCGATLTLVANPDGTGPCLVDATIRLGPPA